MIFALHPPPSGGIYLTSRYAVVLLNSLSHSYLREDWIVAEERKFPIKKPLNELITSYAGNVKLFICPWQSTRDAVNFLFVSLLERDWRNVRANSFSCRRGKLLHSVFVRRENKFAWISNDGRTLSKALRTSFQKFWNHSQLFDAAN